MLNILEWNVRSNIDARKTELTKLLREKKIDVAFITEVDNYDFRDSFNISQYTTFYPKECKEEDLMGEKIRIICLVKKGDTTTYKIRLDLMSSETPSIWVEARTTMG